MKRRVAWAALVVMAVVLAAGVPYVRARQVREALYAALTPVHISNCTVQRYGHANDGGYLMCAELVAAAQAAYSYGIDGRDEWGCDVGSASRIAVHQYDCFNTAKPSCAAAATTMFHAECVGPEVATIDGRVFRTVDAHIGENGDRGKRLVVKMDVEGAEWRALAGAPDAVLDAIDQMAVEFHGVEEAHFLDTVARLKSFFYVAHVHQNNYDCRPGFDPFPGPVFEVLFVNKRSAVVAPSVAVTRTSPLDAPNLPSAPDCQDERRSSEPRRIAGWAYRYATRAVYVLRRSFSS